MIALVLGVLALLMTVVEPYRMARLTGFLNPGADAAGAGFQAAQAKIALGSGGLFGVGIGNGVQKAFYLPEAHTDMISAVIGEELGLVGIVGVVGLFAMFGYAGLQIAQKAKDSYGKLLVAGLTSLILVQATINLFAVMGLAPLTGVPLPFVSYGNSSLLATLFAVGLILNVARGGTAARWQTARRRRRAHARARKEPIEQCQERQEWWWRRGEPRGTSCRPWRSPTSFGLAAPRSPSSAPRERIEAELVPAAGYEIDFVKVRGIDRRNPLRAARGRRSRRWPRSARRARALRRRGADVVMGGGGFVAGPAGLAAALTADAAGPDRGRQPPRPRQPPAGAAGRGGSASPSRSRAARGSATWSPAGRSRRRCSRPTAARPGERFGIAADARCLLVVGGSQGARSINLARDRGLRRARGPRLPRPPPRRPPRLRRAASARLAGGAARRPLHAARLRARPRRRASPPATWSSPAPAARSSRCRGRPAGDPRPLPARHRRPPERQRRLDGAGRGGDGDRRRRAEPGAAAPSEVGGAARRRRAAGGDGRRLARAGQARRGARGSPTRSWRRRDERPMSATGAAAGCTSSASAAPG